jgi:flavorubredoxin
MNAKPTQEGNSMINQSDMNGRVLFEEGSHKFIWLGSDPNYRKGVVQTNQYLIIDGGKGYLLDPGGIHLFARVVSSVSRFISIDKIEGIFFSHQDPDVSSGIALWLGVTEAKIYVSSLWLRFLPHFGIVDSSRVLGIEDGHKSLTLASGAKLSFIPSHFLHSTGNFSLYDEKAKFLFSGDIGAAVFPEGEDELFVGDFEKHLAFIEGFHKRYMASNAAIRKWLSLVSRLQITMLVPQHGAIYKGDAVKRFFSWFENLKCGVDIIDSVYGE